MDRDRLTPAEMKTYGIAAPIASHWRDATCDEVNCKSFTDGWITVIAEGPVRPPASTDIRSLADRDEQRAFYIRHLSGRKFIESRDESGMTVFDFEPGQQCFAPHKVRVDRPELFIVRAGDSRGNPGGDVKVHDTADHWVEDFSIHQDTIKTRLERG